MKTIAVLVAILMLAACDNTKDPASQGAIRIVRDNYGVPHVYADTVYGLYYGYGYSIAQDRLFQLEMARRSTQGTVAEVLGREYVEYDRNARTLFSPASIRRQLDGIAAQDRDVFEGYAAGVNAWIAEVENQPNNLLPKQFVDFDFKPIKWSAYDIAMIFIGTMNNRFGDFNTELENADIISKLVAQHGEVRGRQLFDLLNPRFTDDAPTTIPLQDWSRPAYDSLAETAALNIPGLPVSARAQNNTPSGFSNIYIIGQSKAEGANSILVNGPQFGWFNPSYVYSIGMHGAGIDVVGNTPFGYPMILFGHNRTIAWGSTWGASDIVDLFVEHLNPEHDQQYLYKDDFIDFETRVEEIRVKDGATQELVIYRSVHGPVVRFDRDQRIAYAKKRAWDGRELETLLAWLYSTWASDWNEWKAQAEKSAINVNLYFADVDGNIGYFHGGHFPKRVPGHDNRFPVTGDGTMDWTGRQEIDSANPHVLNPSSGFITNWNNKPGHGVMNPDFHFYSWSAADRVEFFSEALAAKDRFTPDEAWSLLDSSSHADVFVEYFLPVIERAVQESSDPALHEASDTLRSWNRQSRDDDADQVYDEKATEIFRAFIAALVQRTLSDDLGAAFDYFGSTGYPTSTSPTGAGTNLPTGVKAIIEAIEGNAVYDVFNGRSPETIVAESLRDALKSVQQDGLPVAARPFLTRNFLGIPQASEREQLIAPIEQNRGTENNMIEMKPGAIVGWEVTPPGQSGFINQSGEASQHYDDQFELYYRFGKKRTWFYPDDVDANKLTETRLIFQQ